MIGAFWSRVRNHLYDKGLFSKIRPNEFVISIGNLTWGGTGKTALTERLAKLLISRGYKVAILSRGYSRESRGVVMVSDGKNILVSWNEAGDESYWLASKIPQASVVVAESRAEGISALEKFQADVILLDDAFQHRRIERDLDLLLIDASENLHNLHVIPFGKLREPIDSIHRADAVILTHSKHGDPQTLDFVNSAKIPVFHANYYPIDFPFREKKIGAFCGIASPDHFEMLLKEQGGQLVFFRKFPDHHIYSSTEVNQLQEEALTAGAEALVTTGKDAVKLSSHKFLLPFEVIQVELRVEEENFEPWILQAIESKKPAVMNKT
ncbi:MAG TPA: tetraacyldisaccharide 4'-kinase [Acidobacteriota bacterium]|nr:tetraacyldisaccharide 4'-kinase [Acidobacteriota bacterium]